MQDPLETAELLAFTKIVDSRSLSRAAAELAVPRATLSRRLARLEQRLNVRLLRRTTRSLVLTDAGQALYRQARLVLDAVTQAEASVRRTDSAVRGDLRVSVPPLLNIDFYAVVAEYMQRYPEVRLQVHFSTQHVDLLRDGYDVALRASTELEPGLTARVLARMKMVAAASPAYLQRCGTPKSTRDLKQHRCLLGFARGELPQTHWGLANGGKLQVDGVFATNEITLLTYAALAGLGIAFLPTMSTRPHLEKGTLVQVLAGEVEIESRVALVYQEREFIPPQVRAFVDMVSKWVKKEMRGQLDSVKVQEPLRASKSTAPPPRRSGRAGD